MGIELSDSKMARSCSSICGDVGSCTDSVGSATVNGDKTACDCCSFLTKGKNAGATSGMGMSSCTESLVSDMGTGDEGGVLIGEEGGEFMGDDGGDAFMSASSMDNSSEKMPCLESGTGEPAREELLLNFRFRL